MINPINNFKEASTAKKVATVASIAAGAAAIGSVVYAARHGHVADVFKKAEEGAEKVKFGDKIRKAFACLGDGYKELGSAIKVKSLAAWETVKGWFSKSKEKAAQVSEEVAG